MVWFLGLSLWIIIPCLLAITWIFYAITMNCIIEPDDYKYYEGFSPGKFFRGLYFLAFVIAPFALIWHYSADRIILSHTVSIGMQYALIGIYYGVGIIYMFVHLFKIDRRQRKHFSENEATIREEYKNRSDDRYFHFNMDNLTFKEWVVAVDYQLSITRYANHLTRRTIFWPVFVFASTIRRIMNIFSTLYDYTKKFFRWFVTLFSGLWGRIQSALWSKHFKEGDDEVIPPQKKHP
jgi:hypothetical protein